MQDSSEVFGVLDPPPFPGGGGPGGKEGASSPPAPPPARTGPGTGEQNEKRKIYARSGNWKKVQCVKYGPGTKTGSMRDRKRAFRNTASFCHETSLHWHRSP